MYQSMEKFSLFIEDNELIDLPPSGAKFTWPNNQEGATLSRIDCLLISKEWEEHFTGAFQIALPRGVSDHRPILLNSEAVDRGPRPFSFKNCWLLHWVFRHRFRVGGSTHSVKVMRVLESSRSFNI